MFFRLPDDRAGLPAEIQALLDEHSPLPEGALNRLCSLVAQTPETERFATVRRLVVDVDSLLFDLRWHVGHAVLIWKAFPQIDEQPEDAGAVFERIGMPNRAALLLRPFIAGTSRVFYDDALARRPGGGTVAGWILHMLVDDAVMRSIAVLDRLAHLVIAVANVPAPRNRMYFRTGKFREIREKHGVQLPAPLLELAASEEFEFLLKYRDGFAHTVRPTSGVMRTPPVDSYLTDAGGSVRLQPTPWRAPEMAAIALTAFRVSSDAIAPVLEFCESVLPKPERKQA